MRMKRWFKPWEWTMIRVGRGLLILAAESVPIPWIIKIHVVSKETTFWNFANSVPWKLIIKWWSVFSIRSITIELLAAMLWDYAAIVAVIVTLNLVARTSFSTPARTVERKLTYLLCALTSLIGRSMPRCQGSHFELRWYWLSNGKFIRIIVLMLIQRRVYLNKLIKFIAWALNNIYLWQNSSSKTCSSFVFANQKICNSSGFW